MMDDALKENCDTSSKISSPKKFQSKRSIKKDNKTEMTILA